MVKELLMFIKELIEKYRTKRFLLLLPFFIALLIFLGIKLTNKREIAKPPSIVFTQWWEKEADKELLLEIISEFESLHGDFKIILNTCSYEDLRLALFQGASIGDDTSLGDVIALDPLWVSELSKKEIIENINANPVSFINILYYNINLLKEAGFSHPPKTRGEFLVYARSLAESKGSLAGLALGMNSSRGIYDNILPWMWSAGVQLIKDGKPQVSSRQVVDCLSFLASLYSDGLLTPQPFVESPAEKLEDFVTGKAAFIIAPASEIGFVRERMGDEAFGVTSIPIPDNYAGKSFFAVSAWTAGVVSSSAHKEEAKLFASFLAEKAAFISEKMNAIPGNGIPPAYDVFYSKVWDIAIAGEMAQDFSGLNWTALEESFREGLLDLFGGMATAAQTANAIQKRWEGIIF
jgi:ABC-type glycerol-3-phosphate transport system substrate-binding protein